MEEVFRNAGSDILGDMPQGVHACLFYHTKEDLAEVIVPYLKTGLENREFCIWILPEEISLEEAKKGLNKSIPELNTYLKKAQLEIISRAALNTKFKNPKLQDILDFWVGKVNQALNKGYSGLKLAQDLFWLKEKEDSISFLDYEKEVDRIINSSQMTALCSYSLEKFSSEEVLEVIGAHEFSLVKKGGSWRQLGSFKAQKIVSIGKPEKVREALLNPYNKLDEHIKESTVDLHSNLQLELEIKARKRIEEALHESKERFHVLINTAAQAVWETDSEGAVVADSPSWRAYTGQTLEEWLGYGWVNAIHPEDREYAEQQWREAVAANRYVNAEFRLKSPDGGWRWTNVLAAPIRGREGRILKWVGMNIDITERKQAEESLHMAYEEMQAQAEDLEAQTEELRKTNEALSESEKRFKLLSEINSLLLSSEDPQAMVQTIAEKLKHQLSCDIFFNYIFDKASGKLHLNAYSGINPETAKEIEWLDKWDEDTVCKSVALENCLIFAQKLKDNKGKGTELLDSIWVKSYACQKLQIGKNTIGILSFGIRNKKGFTKEELALIGAAADQISVAIERKRAEEALRESQAIFQSFYDSAPFSMGIGEIDEKVLVARSANRATAALFRMNPEDMPGYTGRELGTPENIDNLWLEKLRKSQSEGVPISFEYVDTRFEGSPWLRATISIIGVDSSGKPQYSFIVEDITERKKTEETLRKKEEEQAFLLKLSDALRPLSDPIKIQKTAARILGEHLGVSRVAYGEVTDDDNNIVFERNYVALGVQLLTGSFRMADFGPKLLSALRERHTIVVPDMKTTTELSESEKQAYVSLGIMSLVGVPLNKKGRFEAELVIHNAEPRQWTEAEIKLTEETAERTWAAVERAHAEAELKRSKERYQTLFNSINEGFGYYKAIYDKDGRIYDLLVLEINPAGAKISGVEREKQLGKTWREIWSEVEDYWLEVYRKVDNTGESIQFENFSNIAGRWYSVQIDRVQKGQFAVTFRDITERKEEETRISRYNNVLEGISHILTNAVQTNTEKDLGNICLYVALDITDSHLGFIGVVEADGLLHDIAISNMGWEQCLMYDKTGHFKPPGNFDLEGLYGSVIANEKSFFTNNPSSHPDSTGLPEGHPPINSFLGVPFTFNGNTKAILAVANREGGYSQEQQEDLEAIVPAVIQALERKKVEQEREQAQKALSAAYQELEEKVKIRTSELETAYNSLKENERRLSEAQKMAHIGYWDWDVPNDKLHWSEELYSIFGVHPQKFEGTYKAFLNLIHPEDRAYVENAIKKALTGAPYAIDFRIMLEDGEERIVHVQGKILFNNKNLPVLMRGTAQDITEKKRAEQAFLNSVAARKKEIHHRIKNNLQVISSLLDLQAEKFGNKECLENSEILEAFKESQDRVVSMALIHEELHEGGGNEYLNFSQYLGKLIDHLFMTYTLENVEISLNLDLQEDIFFDMDTAVPLGIIVNELVSNSLKYAFSGREKGEIRIKLSRDENQGPENEIPVSEDEGYKDKEPAGSRVKRYTLIVSDNGIGIPQTISLEDSETLGIQLVTILTDQLDGEIKLNRDTGTEFTIKIPVTEEA